MDDRRIRDPEALEEVFRAPRFLLFKHSPICPASSRAYREVEAFLAARPETPSGWLDVIAERPLAREVAARTGVPHESPQVLLLEAGEATWSTSHHHITVASLEGAVTA